MFKNLTVFRYPSSCDLDIDCDLDDAAAEHDLRPLGSLELKNAGFVRVRDDQFTVGGNGAIELRIGFQEKMLPAAVVNAAVAEKVQKIADEEGRKVGGRERRAIKEDVVTQLLPRAFTRRKDVQVVIDSKNRRVLIDSASPRKAEDVISQIREALGSFPALPQAPEESPRVILTSWLVDPSRLPARLALGDEVVLHDPAEANGRTWRGRRTDLDAEDVTEHLRAGLVVKQLGLVYDERLSFVLDENLVLRKFRMLDDALEDLPDDPENAETERDALRFLFATETRGLLDYLDEIFNVGAPS